MIIVGITGGIGSGKTTVAKAFQALGIPIYIADDQAKALMNRSKIIRKKLIALFGDDAYLNNKLNRPFLAKAIFSDKSLLDKMNAIVHPKVAKHFKRWVSKQKTPYVIKESAILFETKGNKQCDFVITVTAPLELRISRVLKRDNTTKEKILAITKNQLEDEVKIKNSDFVIVNKNWDDTKNQVDAIHLKILKTIQ